jgi:hypothetical protein
LIKKIQRERLRRAVLLETRKEEREKRNEKAKEGKRRQKKAKEAV